LLLTFPFAIPAYWTPEQALTVVELLEEVRDLIWSHYGALHHSGTIPPSTSETIATRRYRAPG
jgi:hypothetical protein